MGLRLLTLVVAFLPPRVARPVLDIAADLVFGEAEPIDYIDTYGDRVRL